MLWSSSDSSVPHWIAWSAAQSLLWPCKWFVHLQHARGVDGGLSPCQSVNEAAWKHWEQEHDVNNEHQRGVNEPIPTVHVQDHDADDLSSYLDETYGNDWRKRPLLLKGLWSREALEGDSNRRLSTAGLLREELEIPYFTDARRQSALSPDGRASIRAIVANITRDGAPHKIGTQLMVQTYPELIYEVAPTDIVTKLFGSYFSAAHVRGSGPFGLFPALTTVPIFVASSGTVDEHSDDNPNEQTANSWSTVEKKPYTALHCEPIGNIAVQLSGQKQWTLVRPEFSHLVRPSVSPDGRAFFASWASDYSHYAPSYTAVTAAGDAMWVPTWTWHRVDYIASSDEELAIGGSLFHFRPMDYVRNNPLFALLMVPAILLELVGYNTQ